MHATVDLVGRRRVLRAAAGRGKRFSPRGERLARPRIASPRRARRDAGKRLWLLGRCARAGALVVLVTVASSCSLPPPRRGGHAAVGSRGALAPRGGPSTPRRAPVGHRTPAERRALAGAAAIERRIATAWRVAIGDFYLASSRDDPTYPPLLAALVPGSPELRAMLGYLSAQAASKVAGPSVWTLGRVRVRLEGPGRALVTACSYDPGSRDLSTGAAAPRDLGGGAGVTQYESEMWRVDGAWLLYSTTTATVVEKGGGGSPCAGF